MLQCAHTIGAVQVVANSPDIGIKTGLGREFSSALRPLFLFPFHIKSAAKPALETEHEIQSGLCDCFSINNL